MLRLAALVSLVSTLAVTGCGKQCCYDCGGPMIAPHTKFEVAHDQLCTRAKELAKEGCSPFDQAAPDLLATCTVVESIYIADIDRCMAEATCAGFQACSQKVSDSGGTFAGPTTSCDDTSHESVPAGFEPGDIERSTGRRDKTFADTVSTKDVPIEVCGMPDQLAYLTRVTCKDGSKPFAARADAAASRTGAVGRGGRCQRTIDEYAVTCPEKTYQVFIDPYRCTRS